jgi:uncharacterized protein YjbI with pentapeptide repeats
VYQWEWVDPSDHSKGKQQSTTLCADGASVNVGPNSGALINLDLTHAYLAGANLYQNELYSANLTNVYASYCTLLNANLS